MNYKEGDVMSNEKEGQFLRALASILDAYDVALCAEEDNVFFMFNNGSIDKITKIYTGRCHSTSYEIALIERSLK